MTTAHLHLVLMLAAQAASPAPLPARHAQALMERMLATEPFLGSAEHRASLGSTGRFFSRKEHARLHGNPVLGYWDAGTFAWRGSELAFDGIQARHRSARGLTAAAWRAAISVVAARHALHLSPTAQMRLEGGCVGAVIDPSSTEPVPGVLLELRLKSPAGTLLYRVGIGKASVEDAMGAAVDLVLGFARSLESDDRGASSHAR
jgi:hypothetical protein